jgi:UDP-N-acetylmuramate dehydrogenase
VKVARAAAEAGIAGLAFYRGIPGSIGGALRMNAGAHGSETKDVLIEACAVDREGNIHTLSLADMGFGYRHSSVPQDFILTQALFQGKPGDPADILREMEDVADYREKNQPIRERTGGSTFKNPPDASAWKLVDDAGCRGLRVGGAKVSDMHCNFLINEGGASAEDIERLGETVRARVKAKSGVTLQWEIIRIGRPNPGRPTGEALAEAAFS